MRIEERIEVAGDPAGVLAWVADFTHLPEWDWSAARVERLGGAGAEVGAAVRVHLGIGPVTTALDYAVAEHEPGARAVLRASAGDVRSEDTIRVEPVPGGTRLTYTADLSLGGLGGMLAPLLRPVFVLHGRIVIGRLATVLAARAAARTAA